MTSRDFAIPSLALTIAASAISATAGYLYARGGSIEAGSRDAKLNNLSSQPLNTSTPLASVNNDDEDSGSEDEYAADGDLAAISARFHQPCKLVLVVRTDLGMTPGKIAAQCSHATLACYKSLVKKNPQLVKHWERTGQAKIALKASSEEQLMELEAIAKSLNLCARSIQDAGRTEVAAGTTTVLGIGPAPVEIINQVTGKLRLL